MNKSIISLVLVGVLSVGYLVLAEEGTDKLGPENRINMPKSSVSPRPGLGVFCGGIAGKQCPDGYVCKLEGSFPDAGGTCIKTGVVKEQKDQLKQNIKDVKTNVKTEIKDTRVQLKNTSETMKEDIKQHKEEFNNEVKLKREEFNNTIKVKKVELENEIRTKRDELKGRLEKIKDERKKETVERIDQRIDVLSDKMMRHFSSVLNKLEEMLIRINERADKASVERGLDVSAVRSAIEKANTAIASARLAIEVQSGKTYIIKVTTESALKTDVGKARQALGADLAKVKNAVSVAHSAVREVAVALAQLVVKPKVSPTLTLPIPSE